MRQIEIEVPIDAVTAIFESNTISTGMTKEAPGGVRMELLPGPMQQRSLGHVAVGLFVLAASLSIDAGKKLFVDWLCEKVKQSRRPSIKINRRTIETITPEAIQRVIEEEIEIR